MVFNYFNCDIRDYYVSLMSFLSICEYGINLTPSEIRYISPPIFSIFQLENETFYIILHPVNCVTRSSRDSQPYDERIRVATGEKSARPFRP